LDPDIDIKNIIKPKYQRATGPATNFKIGRLYSIEEVFQTKFRRALAKGSFTQLSELKALAAKPISQPLQISMKSIRKFFGTI
jgi:hypothetical protein